VSPETVALNHYTSGDPDAPAVFLGASLGTTLSMWDSLADHLAHRYHVVRFDTRGHGSSPVPPGPYTMRALAADVVALADELEIRRFAYVGLSLGGAIGLTLAVEHGDRLTSLVLCCTAAKFGDPFTWLDRGARVRDEGMRWLVDATRERWFTPEFLREHPREADDVLRMLGDTAPQGYAACCDALAAYDLSDRLGEVRTPTRLILAAQDPVTPPEAARPLVEGIAGADEVVIDGAAHIATIARPDRFNAAVAEHLDRTVQE
jgi:3-oxoadipate enol-lactonase